MTELERGIGVIAALHLGESGESGAKLVTALVARHLGGDGGDHLGPFGTRTHERHVALQHVPELRNFVGTCGAHPREAGHHARVAFGGQNRAVQFGIGAHGPEFHEREQPTVATDALLCVEDGCTGPYAHVEREQSGHHDHNGGESDQEQ